MISKLPKWIEVGAFVLASVAGFVNAIGLLGFEHQSVSHLSGIATLLGVGMADSSFVKAAHLLAIMLTFFLGASISGFFLHGSNIKLGKSYDFVLTIESMLLFAAMFLLSNKFVLGHYVASAACGLQNALATTYSGAVIRTTHVTGLFTDLGIMFGARLRGERFDRRKAVLFLIIIIGFIFGGVLGAISYAYFEFYSLIAPGVICFALAFVYRVYLSKISKE